MNLQKFVHNLQITNDFLKSINEKGYNFYSEETGTCSTYREFIDKVYEEFNIPVLVLGADVKKIRKNRFEAVYMFDRKTTRFEFEIIHK